MTTKYDHALTIAFTVISNHPTGDDLTPEMLRAALERRMKELNTHKEWLEAVGAPYDTQEIEE
ncbi:hypothetical protein [Methylocystis sp. ATCC 49242]|uniref:hypothetical protein n=1 Tax=Methylocystis sp. ATCC 49242 TaxID=622637 RepID=UPI0001F87109|nr:hypothetical protein [Methylocystis sp. ATCC 49242]